jgi:hypothetical protein
MKSILTIPRSALIKSIRNIHGKSVDEFSRRSSIAGYQSENHKVKTDDGYILTLHRLLPQSKTASKGSAFLMHGLFRNSADFIASGSKIALAYYLSDHGYEAQILKRAREAKHKVERILEV